ncbi:hypothetical protein BD289DRAFT_443891 [Coniella lustricola]|uniref:Uncharacterized protein n=1 Tax=Coniella lustricola TaxID=2025994 RepID=A0A2T2ZWJ3_9PEZI|nr:hypothetical protein BD289DRAFT_443891 [Coniella lustricola]
MTSREKPDLTVDAAVTQPLKASSQSPSPASGSRSQSPTPPVVTSWTPAKVMRPSDIYRRGTADDEQRQQGTPSSATGPRPGLVSWGSSSGSTGPTHPFAAGGTAASADAAAADHATGRDILAAQPQIHDAPSPAAQRPAAETLPAGTETGPDPQASLSSQPHPLPEPSLQPPSRRFSTSPQLPEFHSVSDFGNDLFGSDENLDRSLASTSQPDAPASMAPTHPTSTSPTRLVPGRTVAQQIAALEQRQPKPLRPSIPGGWVSETTTVPSEGPTPFEEPGKFSGSGLSFNSRDVASITERSEVLSLKPAPLRTPTPRSVSPVKSDNGREPSRASVPSSSLDYTPAPLRDFGNPLASTTATDAARHGSGSSSAEPAGIEPLQRTESQVTPVAPAPLQPRKGSSAEFLAENFRPPVIRAATSGTTGTMDSPSPLKESDMLRDEIFRRLSPVRSSDAPLDTAGRDESATRESAYLSDVYGDYWTSGEDSPGDENEDKRIGEEQTRPLRESHLETKAKATAYRSQLDLKQERRPPTGMHPRHPVTKKRNKQQTRQKTAEIAEVWSLPQARRSSPFSVPRSHPCPCRRVPQVTWTAHHPQLRQRQTTASDETTGPHRRLPLTQHRRLRSRSRVARRRLYTPLRRVAYHPPLPLTRKTILATNAPPRKTTSWASSKSWHSPQVPSGYTRCSRHGPSSRPRRLG